MCENGAYCGDGGYLNEPCRRDTIRRQPRTPVGVGEFTLGVAYGDPADLLELAELERQELAGVRAAERRENPPVVVYREKDGDPRRHHHTTTCPQNCGLVYSV